MKSLKDCRVLDLGIITAGAATSAVLADLGADVIKIESETYKDPFRAWNGPIADGDLPPFFRMTNRGKANLGLDLKTDAGREVFLRLVAKADVVVENFRRGVMGRLGIDFQTLKAANPDIILASISSQGEDGPDANYVSFGSTLEAMGGLSAITGYAGDEPIVSGRDVNYPDQVVAIFASSMIATAWYAKQSGKGGVHLDLSQRELTSFLAGESIIEDPGRLGNGQEGMAVQQCYLSQDNDWVAVSVPPEQLLLLKSLTGAASCDALKKWIAGQSTGEAISALNALGIAAAEVLDSKQVLKQRDRSWGRAIMNDPSGRMVKGVLFGTGERPASVDRPAAQLGADTREVLARVGGYSPDEIEALMRDGVVSEPEAPETMLKKLGT
jgi:crotonobetainyl-CoA:carnitine CoA-transferase CaiB-like acyl-CoA transferase